MAGGPHAETVMCLACAKQGRVTPAQRFREGLENDWYRCPEGHETGVDWSYGAPEAPTWPPSEEDLAAVAMFARHKGGA